MASQPFPASSAPIRRLLQARLLAPLPDRPLLRKTPTPIHAKLPDALDTRMSRDQPQSSHDGRKPSRRATTLPTAIAPSECCRPVPPPRRATEPAPFSDQFFPPAPLQPAALHKSACNTKYLCRC